MEQWKETIEVVLSERFDQVYMDLMEKNIKVKDAVKKQEGMATKMQNHPEYKGEIKQIVEEYLEAMFSVHGEYYRELYIQGAKDCIIAIRELGIIR